MDRTAGVTGVGEPMRRWERGQAMLETVLVAPVLLWLLLVTIGLAHMLFAQMVVVLATDYGAREAALAYGTPGLPESDKALRTRRAAENVLTSNLRRAGWTIDVAPGGNDVTVAVSYPYSVFVPGLGRFFPGGIATLRHTAVFRIEPQ